MSVETGLTRRVAIEIASASLRMSLSGKSLCFGHLVSSENECGPKGNGYNGWEGNSPDIRPTGFMVLLSP